MLPGQHTTGALLQQITPFALGCPLSRCRAPVSSLPSSGLQPLAIVEPQVGGGYTNVSTDGISAWPTTSCI